MLGAGREDQQQFGIAGHRLVRRRQQQFADAFGQRSATRFAGQHHVYAVLAEQRRQVVAVGTLAGAFRPLEGDEKAAHWASPLAAGAGFGAGLDR